MSTSRTREKADGELFKSTGIDDNATSTKVTVSNTGIAVAGDVEVNFIKSNPNNVLTFKLSDNTTVGSFSNTTGALILPLGVALGGTGAANTLDDYEEGTFIPTVRGSTHAGSFSTNSAHIGRYTKIGDICSLSFVIGGTLSGATGSYTQFNLPFTVKAGTAATGTFSYVLTPNLNHVDFSCYVGTGVTLGYFIIKTANTSTPVYPAPSSFMPNAVQIYGTVTYSVA